MGLNRRHSLHQPPALFGLLDLEPNMCANPNKLNLHSPQKSTPTEKCRSSLVHLRARCSSPSSLLRPRSRQAPVVKAAPSVESSWHHQCVLPCLPAPSRTPRSSDKVTKQRLSHSRQACSLSVAGPEEAQSRALCRHVPAVFVSRGTDSSSPECVHAKDTEDR